MVGPDVDGDPSLVAIVQFEDRIITAVPTQHRSKQTRRITTQRFDLHDLGTPVAENP